MILVVLLLGITLDTLAPGRGSDGRIAWYATAMTITVLAIGSLLIHDYAHASAARRIGARVDGVFPALFGGIPDEAYQPASPRDDALVASAGPIASFILTLLAGTVWLVLPDRSTTFGNIVGGVTIANLVLTLGNLLPGFPLDGGRMFRAFIWFLTDDIVVGTRFAAAFGQIIAIVALICGLFMFAIGETLSVWGAWLVLAFWTINRSGRDGYVRTLWRETTSNLTIFDAGLSNSRRIDAERSIDSALDDLLATIHEGPMLVMDQSDVLGIVSLAQIRKVPRSIWAERVVRDVTVPLTGVPVVPHDAPVTDLLTALDEVESQALVAISTHGRISGAVDRATAQARVRVRMSEEQTERRRRVRR